MNSLLFRFAFIVFAIFLGGCNEEVNDSTVAGASTFSPMQDIVELATSYEDLTLMTPDPVFVNPELATLCIGASQEMVEQARIHSGPHANCTVRIFMNDIAAPAFETKAVYPVGSVIVKEKTMSGYRTKDMKWEVGDDGVGGMIKRGSGYDEPNGNWEYFYFESPSAIESGKMESCIECHRKAKASDFVFGDWAQDDNRDPYSN